MVTINELAVAVNADPVLDKDELEDALAIATIELGRVLEGAYREVPAATYEQCVKRYAKNIFVGNSSKTDGGNSGMFTAPDGSAVPMNANDPLRRVYPLIKPYLKRIP